MDLFLFQLGLFSISFGANFFSALSGGGAGLIQLPALIIFGLPFQIALATHKVASIALGLGAAIRYLKEGSLNRGFAVYVLLLGIPGVYLGTRLVVLLPDNLFSLFLGLLILALGIYSIFKNNFGTRNRSIKSNYITFLIGGFVLFIIGLLNGSFTSGTGLFVTIWLVAWFGFSYQIAVAYTLILVGLFWNGAGALFLGIQGHIAWTWLPSLLLGSIFGGYFGAHFGIKVGSRIIKRCFETLSFILGSSLLLRSL